MKQSCNKNIFLYNKNNELITYVDLDDKKNIIAYYELSNNILTKFNIDFFNERNKKYKIIRKAIITFGEKCKLFHMFLDQNESYCKVIKKESSKLDSPIVLSNIYSHNTHFIERYTIKPNLIQGWLEKL